jgi:hypothetical protein
VDELYGKEAAMSRGYEDNITETRITYTLEVDGNFYIVENVPARVDKETGEQFFSPGTVERLRETIFGSQSPSRLIETPVYVYDE